MMLLKNILRWSERYTKTDMTYLVKGGSWLLLGQGITFFISMILLWGFTNLLPKETYGQYRFILTAASLLALATLPGMNTALMRAVSRGNTGMLHVVIREKLRWGLLGSVLAGLVSLYYFIQGDPTLSLLFLVIMLFVSLYETFALYQNYLIGLKQFKHNSVLYIFQRAVVASSVLTTMLLTKDILVLVLVFFISTTLVHVVSLYTVLHFFPTNDNRDDETITYGRHLSVMSTVRLGAQYLDKIVLWYFAGPVQVATYVIAMAVPNEITSAAGQISNLAFPKMAAKSKEDLRKVLVRKVLVFFIALIPVVLFYIFFAPILFSTFFPQYVDAVIFSQFAALSIFVVPGSLFMQYFLATKHTKALYATNIFEPLLLLSLFATLIPLLGTFGAVAAVITKNLLTVLIYAGFFLTDKSV